MRKSALFAAIVAALVAAPVAVYASHQFNDVPPSHTFHNSIGWMADNGITVGCNPPDNDRYCPQDSVNRGQMSAFMKRLAENRVVDAGTLDGMDSTELVPILAAEGNQSDAVTGVSRTETNSVTIEAPVDGVLQITGSVFVNNHSGTTENLGVFPKVDGSLFLGSTASGWSALQLAAPDGTGVGETFTLSYSLSTEVTAGSHTVSQEVGPTTGSADFFYNKANLNVLFVPLDQFEVSLAGVSGSGDGSE